MVVVIKPASIPLAVFLVTVLVDSYLLLMDVDVMVTPPVMLGLTSMQLLAVVPCVIWARIVINQDRPHAMLAPKAHIVLRMDGLHVILAPQAHSSLTLPQYHAILAPLVHLRAAMALVSASPVLQEDLQISPFLLYARTVQ